MIVVVCGPPAAGKTTVATRLRDRLADRGRSFRLVDSDRFGTNTYDRLYDLVAGTADDWIVAGTFYERRWLERFRGLGDVFVVRLSADLATCLERNRRREAPIDEVGVHVVWREFEDPDADLAIDTTERSPEAVVDRVVSALPVEPA